MNRKMRRKNKEILEAEPANEDISLIGKDEAMNKYSMDKDGKHWVDPKEYPKVIRK